MYGLDVAAIDAGVVLVPVPWEATTSYGRGTAKGPEAIRVASRQVDLFDVALARAGHELDIAEVGVAMLVAEAGLLQRSAHASELGGQVVRAHHEGRSEDAAAARDKVNEASAWLNDRVSELVSKWSDRARLCGVVGGDHSVAFGSIRAHAAKSPGLGVLQFDAHADLRMAYQGFVDSHASVMHRVVEQLPEVARLVSVGVRDLCAEEYAAAAGSADRIVPFYFADMARRRERGETFDAVARDIAETLPDRVYVSFDIDGLDPSLCPHTGTPVPGGLSLAEADAVLRAVVASGRRIVGFDLCEVAPGPVGEWDANVGARVLLKLISCALASQHD